MATAVSSARPKIGRRAFLSTTALSTAALAASATAGLTSCTVGGKTVTLSLTSPLPTTVPSSASLSISIITTELALKASGQYARLPFSVSAWPNVSAGPDVIQGFRARSIDLASNAGIPPIQAHSNGLDAKIVAVGLSRKPLYKLATAPGSGLTAVSQFRGKKIAFSQGQAQGVVVLRALALAGIDAKDVELVPLTSDQFLTALEAKQVDVAPLWEPVLTKYLTGFARDGAGAIYTPVIDRLAILWAPTEVLEDKTRAAAIRAFIPFWARAQIWAYEHPEEWIKTYYVGNQGVSQRAGELIVKAQGKPLFPPKWDSAIAWEQQTADLLAAGGYDPKIADVSVLFDRRFEGLASAAVPATYRS